MNESEISLHLLRGLWKPHKTRLALVDAGHPTNVRFHRACSWLQHAESIGTDQHQEVALVNLWVAFNALYGQWDGALQQPVPDTECWKHMLERLLELDQTDLIPEILCVHRTLAIKIFGDPFLSRFFWQNPSEENAQRSRTRRYAAQTWFAEKRWLKILEALLERIYLLRCQLVHGAATFGSSLNRSAVRHCSIMMDHLLRAFLLIWVEDGADEDWGIMCYPPLKP
ncbi:MAG: hypothetical protein CBB71_02630 [Rhodopirellula sp. TMED11]|nr:MAG: hypothetical protein CBB71_02630 [Rhodopirellula sp. TMED11]